MADQTGLTRRGFLAGVGSVGVGATVAGYGGYLVGHDSDKSNKSEQIIAFHGTHQAGIATPVQDRLIFGAYDVIDENVDHLIAVLKQWSAACEKLTQGIALDSTETLTLPPTDTGEAIGLSAARLTVTVGFGPSLFEKDGKDRFGLASKRPAALVDLPNFAGEELDPTISNGDIGVQICSDDPQVAFHAFRNLTRIGKGVVRPRWSQQGFGRTSSTSTNQKTARNLQGFKDGTNNLKIQDPKDLNNYVWAKSSDGPAWMTNGSYVVTRRIRMLIEVWDRSSLDDQQKTIGRFKYSGAPLTGKDEFDVPDLASKSADGSLTIPEDAHIRLVSARATPDFHFLRRGFSYTDGADSQTGQLDSGLFFICYQRDPRKQFIPAQKMLAAHDALNEYIVHTSSAIFACPAGIRQGEYFGQALFS